MCIITIQSAVSELLGVSNIKEWSSAIGTSTEEEEEEEETQAVGAGLKSIGLLIHYVRYRFRNFA